MESPMYSRDAMTSYCDLEAGLSDDLQDDSSNSGLANSFQCEYQELGLDPVVTNLNLDRVHPTIHNLAQATQANAASSLMALHKSDVGAHGRTEDSKSLGRSRRPELESPSGKRMRTSGKGIFTPTSRQWETPVRERVDSDGSSPSSGHHASGFESPVGRDLSFNTPSMNGLSPSASSPKGRRQDDHTLGKGRHQDPSPHRSGPGDMQAPRTPDSDDDEISPPPSAVSKGKGKPRARAMPAVSVIPSPADKNKKDKGLREFSLRVCRQVEARMVTTYNEVADELVKEFKNDDPAGDEKNIRRRAYDALNVLTAMDIISKDKKDIQWKGFPNLSGDGKGKRGGFAAQGGENEKDRVRAEIREKQKEINSKEGQLEDLSIQFLSLLQLLKRNERNANETVNKHRIYLPFVLVSTDYDNNIECDLSPDLQTANFHFTKPFELHDDRETLNMMQMYKCDEQALKEHLPAHLVSFIKEQRPDVLADCFSSAGGSSSEQGRVKFEVKQERKGDDVDDDY